jgi:cytochrome P450
LLAPVVGLDQDALRCPYPAYAAEREQSPVWLADPGFWAVLRHADVVDALRRPDVFKQRHPEDSLHPTARAALAVVQQRHPEMADAVAMLHRQPPALATADPPVHTRHRALVANVFRPSRIAELEPGLRALANALVDAFIDDGRCELLRQYATPIPLTTIARLLGVAEEMMPEFHRWSELFLVAVGNRDLPEAMIRDSLEARLEFWSYFSAELDARRRAPRDDLLTEIALAEDATGERLTEAEMLVITSQLLTAGNETTSKWITSSVHALCRQPELMARARADSTLIPVLLEEILRLESPVQGLFRRAVVDVQLGDALISAGDLVWLSFGSANRDPAQFPEPDEACPERPELRTHVAFAAGPHFCLGAPLARAEARIAIEVILARLDQIELASENSFTYQDSFILHGLTELHVDFVKRVP